MTEQRPGYYTSPIPRYPGYVQFKEPWEWQDFTAYWNAYHQHESAGKNAVENTEAARMWRAAMTSLAEWAVEGVPKAACTEAPETVPMEVVTWVRGVFAEYITPFLVYERLLARYDDGSRAERAALLLGL